MKKNISIFLLGIFASICIGASISNSELLTVKPANPKLTVVLYDFSNISEWVSKGFQVQHISNGSSGREYIIMVKY